MVVEFAGAGGDSQGAAVVPGVKHILAANHNQLALASHEANFPDVEHLCDDITKTPMDKLPPADLFWASPACFVAGTLILSRRGLVPIEGVRVGDEVLTHQRRWRAVTSTMNRPAATVTVAGVGLPSGVETTAEHPFFTRQRRRLWSNDIRRWSRTITEVPEWTEAKDLDGHLWATPVEFGDQMEIPEVPGREIPAGDPFWWMVGRWLGDGCVAAGIPFFFKQIGGRTPSAGGRILDGRTWDEYPHQRNPAEKSPLKGDP